MQACHNLERIELYDCLRITREGIRKLRVLCPVFFYFSIVHTLRAESRCVRYAEKAIGAAFPVDALYSARHARTYAYTFAYHATADEL